MRSSFEQRVAADRAHIGTLEASARAWTECNGLSVQDSNHIDLAIEELVTNVICHGRPAGEPAWVELRIELRNDWLEVRVIDNTAPFDPFRIPPPDLEQDIDARPIGGLGIYFVRTLMDAWRYERSEGRNVVTLQKRLSQG